MELEGRYEDCLISSQLQIFNQNKHNYENLKKQISNIQILDQVYF